MKKQIKIMAIITLIILLIFGIINIVWYKVIHSEYVPYTIGLEEFKKNVSYVLEEDGFLYNVKLPDYLSFTGNLCVATNDGKYVLLIWPNAFNNSAEYEIQIENEDKEILSIMVDKNINAFEDHQEEVINDNREIINELLEKAKGRWQSIDFE